MEEKEIGKSGLEGTEAKGKAIRGIQEGKFDLYFTSRSSSSCS